MPAVLFEYAVIRIVPRVEREEFFNVGVILYCREQKFLQAKIHLPEDKLRAFCSKSDIDELQAFLNSFHTISAGGKQAGTIGELPIEERFRWLTAVRSTVVQTSRVHTGLCNDATQKLDQLFTDLVV